MDNIFEHIKNQVPFETVANEYGINFKNKKAHCPFHEEKTPSFHNYGTHGKCFGCEKSADAIEIEAHFKGLSPLQAAKSLAERYNINIEPYLDNNHNSDLSDTDIPNEKSQNKSQSEKLVDLILNDDIELFHDSDKTAYAQIKRGSHFEYYKIRGKDFRLWLTGNYWDKYQKTTNSNSMAEALNIAEAKALFDGKEHKLFNRVAKSDIAIMYDLRNWHGVIIDKNGWSILELLPSVFKSYPHQKIQVEPIKSELNELYRLFNYINIQEADYLLFLSDLTFAYVADLPHPILALMGDFGTAKTTAAKVIKSLVDPSELEVLTPPSTKQELAQLASHHWVLPFDNLHTIPQWFSDSLCKIVSGDGFSKRELYSDDNDIFYSYKRKCILTSINQMLSSPDVLSRSIIFQLEPIHKDKRKEESVFWKDFNREKPMLLGAIFSLISKTLANLDNVNHKPFSRLADFEKWGCAVALALGREEEDFISEYKNNIELQNRESIESSPVAKTLLSYMEFKEYWEGSPSELLNELNPTAEELKYYSDRKYPKDPRWLWRRLKEVSTDLYTYGIEIKHEDTCHGERAISITNNNLKNDAHVA